MYGPATSTSDIVTPLLLAVRILTLAAQSPNCANAKPFHAYHAPVWPILSLPHVPIEEISSSTEHSSWCMGKETLNHVPLPAIDGIVASGRPVSIVRDCGAQSTPMVLERHKAGLIASAPTHIEISGALVFRLLHGVPE